MNTTPVIYNSDNRGVVESMDAVERPWYIAFQLFDKCSSARAARIGHSRSIRQTDDTLPVPFE